MCVCHVDGRGGGWVDLRDGQRPPVGRVVVPAGLLGLVARALLLLAGRPVLHVDLALLHEELLLELSTALNLGGLVRVRGGKHPVQLEASKAKEMRHQLFLSDFTL